MLCARLPVSIISRASRAARSKALDRPMEGSMLRRPSVIILRSREMPLAESGRSWRS